MDPRSKTFLEAVLGPNGAAAINRATARCAGLGALVVPRTALAWVAAAAPNGYAGLVPGTQVAVELRKSEAGVDGVIGGRPVSSLFEAAAVVAVVVGAEVVPAELRMTDISRLGRSVDGMVRARLVKAVRDPRQPYQVPTQAHDPGLRRDRGEFSDEELGGGWQVMINSGDRRVPGTVAKIHQDPENGNRAYAMTVRNEESGEHETYVRDFPLSSWHQQWSGMPLEQVRIAAQAADWHTSNHTAHHKDAQDAVLRAFQDHNSGFRELPSLDMRSSMLDLDKTDLPAKRAEGDPAGAPLEADAPSRVQKRAQKAPKPTLAMSEAQVGAPCRACGAPMFRAGRLSCTCWSALADGLRLTKSERGYDVHFGAGWDAESVASFVQDRLNRM